MFIQFINSIEFIILTARVKISLAIYLAPFTIYFFGSVVNSG